MRSIRRRPRTMLTATACAVALGAAVGVPVAAATETSAAAATSICTSPKHPHIAAVISAGIRAAVAGRPGSFVAVTASDPAVDLNCSLNNTDHFYAASVIKVTILSALLMKVGGPSHLTAAQKNLAVLMITQSDNAAAQTLWEEEGIPAVQNFLDKAGMTETEVNDAWGLTRITAHDELRLLQVLTDSTVLSSASRGYVLTLMSEVISSERWGISSGAPSVEKLHIKNGWLNYPGVTDWNINSIGTFTGPEDYEIVVLSAPSSLADGQSEAYGIDTDQAAAYAFNHHLALWSHV
jgi:Beta-lactamase enzyme family